MVSILIDNETAATLKKLRAKHELETGNHLALGKIAERVIKSYGDVIIAAVKPNNGIQC